MNRVVIVASIAIASMNSLIGQVERVNSKIDYAESTPGSIEFEKSEIRFSSRCEFGIVRNPLMAGFRPEPGRIVTTDSHLSLITRHGRYLFSKEMTTTPIRGYQGIALTDTQVQLSNDRGHILVIQFNTPLSKKVARDKLRELYRSLADSGVREMATSKEFVKLRRPARRGRLGSYGGRGYGGFYEQQPPRPNESYGSPYPVGGQYDR